MKLISLLFTLLFFTAVSAHAQSSSDGHRIQIKDAYARATMKGMPVGGAFMHIMNEGDVDDRLISAKSNVAETTEVHEMVFEGDIMKMREMADGLAIPKKDMVELKPGGYHIMFIGLKAPLIEGEGYPLSLFFEKAGQVDIIVHARNLMPQNHNMKSHSVEESH